MVGAIIPFDVRHLRKSTILKIILVNFVNRPNQLDICFLVGWGSDVVSNQAHSGSVRVTLT